MPWRLVPCGRGQLFLVVLGLLLLLLGEVHHGSGARTASLPRLLPAEGMPYATLSAAPLNCSLWPDALVLSLVFSSMV